jgi:hypothetical protein
MGAILFCVGFVLFVGVCCWLGSGGETKGKAGNSMQVTGCYS